MNWLVRAFKQLTCSHCYKVIEDYDSGRPKLLHHAKLRCDRCGHMKLAEVIPIGIPPRKQSLEDFDE